MNLVSLDIKREVRGTLGAAEGQEGEDCATASVTRGEVRGGAVQPGSQRGGFS